MPDKTPPSDLEERLKQGPFPVVTPPGERAGMLPGVAAICMFLLLVTMLNAFGALRGAFVTPAAKYSVLGVCTLLLVGIFGLLRLLRWGWAIVVAGCLLMSIGDVYFFAHTRAGFFLIRGLLEMVFFLYLSRTEVRERMR
jgi:hypothetical protein